MNNLVSANSKNQKMTSWNEKVNIYTNECIENKEGEMEILVESKQALSTPNTSSTKSKQLLALLKKITDKELLHSTKTLVQKEREILVQVLHHLLEIDRRKLFCELGYQNLLEYAVKELKYSESQACRRIQAMRLMKELPEIETKIEKGSVSLSNLSQAQSFFRQQKQQSKVVIDKKQKIELVEKLENQSTREGQKILLQMQTGSIVLPKEKTRLITEEHTEVKFVMNKELEEKIEELKALLGSKAIFMNFSELLMILADIGINELRERKFGKKRVQKSLESNTNISISNNKSKNPRYIPKSIKHEVWQRDKGRCTNCKSTHNLNFDHIRPVAVGGRSTTNNIRLLCFNCNQREAIKSFGEKQFSFYNSKANITSKTNLKSKSKI